MAQKPTSSAESMARRMVDARAWLVDVLAEVGGVSNEDAEKAADFYVKNKIAKLDLQMGRYTFAHGAYVEAAPIRLAVSVA